MTKLCVDCKFAIIEEREGYPHVTGSLWWKRTEVSLPTKAYDCARPMVDPVTGRPLTYRNSCTWCRSDQADCGADGKFFEPKPRNPDS